MNELDQVYAAGFMNKCAEMGIEPEALLKQGLLPLEGAVIGTAGGALAAPVGYGIERMRHGKAPAGHTGERAGKTIAGGIGGGLAGAAGGFGAGLAANKLGIPAGLGTLAGSALLGGVGGSYLGAHAGRKPDTKAEEIKMKLKEMIKSLKSRIG